QCRRSRRPSAQARLRPGAAQAAARLPRSLRRRPAHPALLPHRFHPRQRAAHHAAGAEAAAASRGSVSEELKRTYDVVADDYVTNVFDELEYKPLDRALLDEIAVRAAGGVICDLGCGPGQVARYLHER